MTTITKDLASSERVATAHAALDAARREAADLREMVDGDDAELAAEASAELERLEAETLPALENALAHLLLPSDDADENDAIVEVRAGAGGDEAAIFAGDLVRMYEAHARRRGWRFELLAASASDVGGGFKEATAEVTGADAYGALKFESGVHRVQRVPSTETQGRVHTSTASVAVLPRAEEVDVEISDKDVRVDTMRASGAGGQHVNTTCSAVRVTHLETGIVVVIQDERSQHKNREKAMSVLRSRVFDAALRKSRAERSEKRRSLVGSGDRSERVRTYNYKEGRVKDHRVNVLSNDLAGIMEGGEALAEMMDALREEEKRRALEELMETTE
jgi:peptide chain release factor 1